MESCRWVEVTRDNKWRALNPLSLLEILETTSEDLPKGCPKSIDLLKFRISHISTTYFLHFIDLSTNPFFLKFPDIELYKELTSFGPEKLVVSNTPPFAILALSKAKLWFLDLQDKKWRPVDGSRYKDVVFHKGKFYAVDIEGKVVSVCASDLKTMGMPMPWLDDGTYRHSFLKNLLVSNGKLYLIDIYAFLEDILVFYAFLGDDMSGLYALLGDAMWAFNITRIKIYKLNEQNRVWEEVCDLDDHVFVVGDKYSYSLSAREFPALKPNCVYFSVNADAKAYKEKLRDVCKETGVYRFDDDTCRALADFPDHWPLLFASPNFA